MNCQLLAIMKISQSALSFSHMSSLWPIDFQYFLQSILNTYYHDLFIIYLPPNPDFSPENYKKSHTNKGIKYINVGQNLLLLAKVWGYNFFNIIKSWFLTHFVVWNFLLVLPKYGMEQNARNWTVEIFAVFFLNF